MAEVNKTYFQTEFIDRVKEATDFASIVSQYTSLEQKSGKLVGKCPFHQETHPSFNVNTEEGLFYCFGCGKGGNLFDFVQEMESLSFPEAVKYLANKAGLELPKVSKKRKRQAAKYELFFSINEKAKKYFRKKLFSSEGKEAREYLQNRNISEDTIEDFDIGVAPPDWKDLTKFLCSELDINRKTLLKLGLVKKSKGNYYDAFRQRIIFPIVNPGGQTVGFAGRIYKEDDDSPAKYLNCPNTPVYKKKKVLYGLNNTRRHIQKEDYALLLEGYTDLIGLWEKGVKNGVATCGTAFTRNQAQLIGRYTNNVVIMYDGDNAGVKATLRAIPFLLSAGIDVEVFPLDPEEDPDSLIQEIGAEGFQKRLKDIPTWFRFVLKYLMNEIGDDSPSQIEKIARKFSPYINSFGSKLTRQIYAKKLSNSLNLPVEAVQELVQENKKDTTSETLQKLREKGEEISKFEKLELELISLVLFKNSFIEKAEKDNIHEHLSHYPGILSRIIEIYNEGKTNISTSEITEYIANEQIKNYITSRLFEFSSATDSENFEALPGEKMNLEDNFKGVICKLKLNDVKNKIEELKIAKNKAQEAQKEEEAKKITQELKSLQQKKVNLSKRKY